jgi:ribonuclease J
LPLTGEKVGVETTTNANPLGSPASLKVIPLGGLSEIGKNIMAIIYGNDMILVDAGLGFPSEDLLGVDIVLPDISFLKEQESKLRGLVITHGHEDHIGAVPYIVKDLQIPVIYGSALSIGLLEEKLGDVGLLESTILRQVKPRQQVKLGCFTVQFIRCTHSIADAYSLIIQTPLGNLVHTGDFKFDFTPVDGELFDFATLTRVQEEEGILLLMSDSTNTERAGFTPSERTVWSRLDEVFAGATERIIVTTFASNVHRMRQIMQAALKYDRKVAILGRSMLNLAGIARELGYMNFPDGMLLKIDEIKSLGPDKVVIMTTGSQGEPLSALTRIARNEHKQVKIMPGDTVIVSATPIPGNERLIANTINQLCMRGANVVYGSNAGVHVSGHACREEQKLMLNLCKPKFFMPVHGDYRMLVGHAGLAVECGVDPNNAFIMENGDVLEIFKDRGAKIGRVKAGIVLIDNSTTYPIDQQTVEERLILAEDGVINIALTMSEDAQILVGPEISMRGLILPRGTTAEEFVEQFKAEVLNLIAGDAAIKKLKGADLKNYLVGLINRHLHESMKSQPLVQLLLQEVPSKGTGACSPARQGEAS